MPVGDRGNHLVVFVLKVFAHRSGEDEDLGAGVAEDQQFHVALQIV